MAMHRKINGYSFEQFPIPCNKSDKERKYFESFKIMVAHFYNKRFGEENTLNKIGLSLQVERHKIIFSRK